MTGMRRVMTGTYIKETIMKAVKSLAITLSIFMLAVTTSAFAGGDDLSGTWTPTAVEFGGKALPKSEFGKNVLVMTGKSVEYKTPAGPLVGTYSVNGASSPKEINVDITADPAGGARKTTGIYKLSGKSLQICLDNTGQSRPKEFKTKADSQEMCMKLTRSK